MKHGDAEQEQSDVNLMTSMYSHLKYLKIFCWQTKDTCLNWALTFSFNYIGKQYYKVRTSALKQTKTKKQNTYTHTKSHIHKLSQWVHETGETVTFWELKFLHKWVGIACEPIYNQLTYSLTMFLFPVFLHLCYLSL